jgi:hypothetical protein
VAIEHLAIVGAAFPRHRGFGVRGAPGFFAGTCSAAIARHRGNARRVFAGRADQRLRFDIQLALARLRGARRVLESHLAVRAGAAIHGGSMCGHRDGEQEWR